MKKSRRTLRRTAGGMALALGLGCGTGTGAARGETAPAATASGTVGGGTNATGTTTPLVSDPAQVDASIRQSLDRLRSLQIVSVGNLVLNLPAEATACYGLPCPDGPWVGPAQLERARQAPRLAQLASLAETENTNAYLTAATPSEGAAAVAALAALKIVEVTGLINSQPNASGCPYGYCHEGDQAAADRENAMRAAKASAIAAAATRSGL